MSKNQSDTRKDQSDTRKEMSATDGSEVTRREVMVATAATAATAAGVLGASAAQAYDAPEAVKQSIEKTGRVRLAFGQAQRNWLANIAYWYEFPTNDPNVLEVWGYTDKLSYSPGDEVSLHVNTTAASHKIEVYRDGGTWELVHEQEGIAGVFPDSLRG